MKALLARIRRVTAETVKKLKQELQHIEDEKRRLTADLDEAADTIRQTLNQLGASHTERRSPSGKAAKVKKGKRIRRTPAQLKQEAEAIIDFIKSQGSEGASGPDIRARHAKIGPDLKGFVQNYSGRKLKTTGVARSMRYFAN